MLGLGLVSWALSHAFAWTYERADCFDSGAGFQQFDNERSHQGGDLAVRLLLGHCQFIDRAITEFGLGGACLDDGLELAEVQGGATALAPAVDVSLRGRIGSVRPDPILLQNYFDHNPLVSTEKSCVLDRSRCLQSMKMPIQRGVFHVQAGNIESPHCVAAK